MNFLRTMIDKNLPFYPTCIYYFCFRGTRTLASLPQGSAGTPRRSSPVVGCITQGTQGFSLSYSPQVSYTLLLIAHHLLLL